MKMSGFSASNKKNDFKILFAKYFRHKYWFLLSFILCMLFCYAYISYSVPKYRAGASVQVIEEKSAASQLSAFSDLDILPGGNKKVEDEIEIIRSRPNFIEVVKNLSLNEKIYHLGSIRNSEIYDRNPITFTHLSKDSIVNDSKFSCFIVPLSETQFSFRVEDEDKAKKYTFGDEIETKTGRVTILPGEKDALKSLIGERLKIELLPTYDAALNYSKALKTSLNDKYSSVINLTIQDPVQQKAIDILNELIKVYNRNGQNDKKVIADRTAEFIDDRIAGIYNDLSAADQSAQDFKSGRGLTDIRSQSDINLNISAASEKELQNAQIKLQLAEGMKDILDSQEDYKILPSNIGLDDPSITSTTARFNQLVLERERLLKSSNRKNPVIVNIDEQLENIRLGMQSSLNGMTNNLNLRVNNLSSQVATVNSKIYSAPRNERALRDITRKQQTVESLYLYLLQKKEEAQIAYASASPNSKIVNPGFASSKFPVSPKKPIIVLFSLILSFLLPIGIIYGLELFDDKVHNSHSLSKLISDIPVIGELPRLKTKDAKLVKKDDRSVLAEALRIIRTNIDYLLQTNADKEKPANVIFITSNLPKEGKTFLSTNLAMIFANSYKKILLIGADIRNPKFHALYGEENEKAAVNEKLKDKVGLTNYLFDDSLTMSDIVNKHDVNGNTLDVILSGKSFPNPSELLMNGRMKILLEKASKRYDYVLVDTAPMMPVTDTLLISKFANLMIYVLRAGKTNVSDIDFPVQLKTDGKIANLAFVVNSVKSSELGYGGKYGYGYGNKDKKWWKR
jgi:capsular exopolysaccharide synthesis family protein